MRDDTQTAREMYLWEWVAASLPRHHAARRAYERLVAAALAVVDAQENRPHLWLLPYVARRVKAVVELKFAVEEAERTEKGWIRGSTT